MAWMTKGVSRLKEIFQKQSVVGKAAILGGAVLAVGGLGWLLWPSSQTDTTTVIYREHRVQRGEISEKVSALGVLKPIRTQEIKASADGTVVELLVQETDQVEAGQGLMRMDNSASQAMVSSYEAALAQARYDLRAETAGPVPSSLAKAESVLLQEQMAYDKALENAQQMDELYRAGAVAKSEWEQAQRDLAIGEKKLALAQAERDAAANGVSDKMIILNARVKEAEANLKKATQDYNNTEIRAPFAGRVLVMNVEVGSVVSKEDILATVADLSTIRGSFYVNEIDIAKVRLGMEAQVKVDALGGKVFKGTVSRVGQEPKTVDNVVNYEVLVDIDNSAGELRSGMTMAADIVINAKQAVTIVPLEALIERNGQTGVMLGTVDNPQFRPVKVGLRSDVSAEIIEGLQEGDIILVGGQRRTTVTGGGNPGGGGAPPMGMPGGGGIRINNMGR